MEKKRAKAIMIQGTMSNAGKSLLAAGLCRIFRQDGYSVAPFKSQNMALNSGVTADGREMGRAQIMQAQAAGVEPDVCMNPILLKPMGDTTSQVILQGRPVANMRAADYFQKKTAYIPAIRKAYDQLDKAYDVVVIEGAGSPAEINLKEKDIVNMGLAEMLDAPVLLAGDIDRGGVFAQLYGTWALLESWEQERIRGLLINKFRGDVDILKPGFSLFAKYCPVPVLGVMPYLDLDLDEEDSLAERLVRHGRPQTVDVAVIRLPHISNFTDFAPLERVSGLSLRYVRTRKELQEPDLIILPGTKNTMGDLLWLEQSGLKDAILAHQERGGFVLGICGGYQMLGTTIKDPCGAEGRGERTGLGLLPVETTFSSDKTTTVSRGRALGTGAYPGLAGCRVSGYELHMGESVRLGGEAFACLGDGQREDGCVQKPYVDETREDGCVLGTVAGTYLHGVFDEDDFRRSFCAILFEAKGLEPPSSEDEDNLSRYRETQFDRLAAAFREACDLETIYRIIGL